MQDKITVLIVDDSAFMRKFISDMINNQSDMQVIDTAIDGEDAVEKIRKLRPDVATLDVEMPKKNGLEVLKEVSDIPTKIIMVSGMTARGSSITLEALQMGAFDFIQKPSGFRSLKIGDIQKELTEKIRYAKAAAQKGIQVLPPKKEEECPKAGDVFERTQKIEAVALGASTGGPRILFDVITAFPKDMNIPIFVVQHMPAGFTKAFAERINNNSQLLVVEASDGENIERGKVYIAPGGYHMLIDRGKIVLDTSPTLHGVRPAVDKLFASAAEVYQEKLLCCVFTGMGKDGAKGARAVKMAGGVVLVQDEKTSVIYGMPRAVAETGCVDLILPGYQIGETIVNLVKNK